MILAYSIGYAANSLPIPGGIGVLDAGLTGALVLYGISPVHAAAAVIVYHAIAFWVPGLGGLIAYLRLRPRLLGAGAHTPADPQPPPETHAFEEARYARTHIDAQTDPSSVSLTWRADPADASVLAQDGKSECRFRALGASGWTADYRGASEPVSPTPLRRALPLPGKGRSRPLVVVQGETAGPHGRG